MSGFRTLPDRPNLGFHRKETKARLKALRAGDAAARAWFEAAHPRGRSIAEPTLADIRLAHARDHGFSSWARLKARIDGATGADRPARGLIAADLQYHRDRADGLLASLEEGDPGAIRLVARLHPRFRETGEAGAARAAADGTLDTDDAKVVVAASHGFADWPAFADHVRAVAAGRTESPFLSAVVAVKAGDTRRLAALLDDDPGLVNMAGTNGNRLANIAVNAKQAAAFELLVARGADVDLGNDKGWTPLHDAAYATPHRESTEDLALLEAVIAAGASTGLEARGRGGTPLAVALFWGHRAIAERLAAEAVEPLNLRTAAGLGRVDLIDGLLAADGSPTAQAGRDRAFHRPHGGFPLWRPNDDPQEILDEALVFTAKAGRIAAMDRLLAAGASPDGEPYNGRALHWAAANRRLDAIDRLLAAGADIDGRARFGGLEGVTALQVAVAWDGKAESVAHLLSRGADIWPRDPLYGSTAAGFANHFGNESIERMILEDRADHDFLAALLLDDEERARRHLAADPGLAARRDDRGRLPADLAALARKPAVLAVLEAAGAPRAPSGTTVTRPAIRQGASGGGGDGDRILHIRCGSDIFGALDEARVSGDRLEWGDPICCGPLPPDLAGEALVEVRAAWLAAIAKVGEDEIRDAFARQAAALDGASAYDRLILWFEHDLYDQSVLIQLLPELDRRGLVERAFLLTLDRYPGVERFLGLGQLSPAQLAGLLGTERPVTRAQVTRAAEALAAFRAPTPEPLAALIATAEAEGGGSPLPFLAGALRRHLAELPGVRDGLSLTERLILRALAEGIDTPGAVFGALTRRLDPQPHAGDAMTWPVFERLAGATQPAITPAETWRTRTALTAAGRDLLAGEADWVALNGLDRWVGGVRLEGRTTRWRWDPDDGTAITGS
ncbi:MAG: ankyrin repeat domain-containing protein [Azospirillaceae bacterium]